MNTHLTENTSQYDQLANGCTALIDFSISNHSTALVTAEFAEKHQQDLLDSIRHNDIFNHLVSMAFGQLENRFNRIVFNFDGSKLPKHIDLASEIGCSYVVLVPTGTENPIRFNMENTNHLPLGAMGDPNEAFREILRELAEHFEKNSFSTPDSSTCRTERDRDE